MFYKSLQSWAVDENWTRDLFLTKEVLYHWATTAKWIWISFLISFSMIGAKDGTQTRDPQLGRLMLYQLSYFRKLIFNYSISNNQWFKLEIGNCIIENCCGQWRIRTSEVERQLSYSQPQLATLVTAQINKILSKEIKISAWRYMQKKVNLLLSTVNFRLIWASCRIRTNDPEITNHVLWPTELKRQIAKYQHF